jgi:hypothetical protein
LRRLLFRLPRLRLRRIPVGKTQPGGIDGSAIAVFDDGGGDEIDWLSTAISALRLIALVDVVAIAGRSIGATIARFLPSLSAAAMVTI